MNKTLHWGILGLGKIAHNFTAELHIPANQIIQAVASRDIEKAKSFANKYGAVSYYGRYEEMLADPLVDIIYIATPHNLHREWSIKAMEEGKHVLCEKPAAINRLELEEMISVAQAKQVFFMEALWTRFNRCIISVLEKIKRGAIGEVRSIQADFAFSATMDPTSRLFNKDLAGGATLDIGIYPLFLSYLVLGVPKVITAKGIMHETGIDIQTSVICEYENAMANLYAGLNSESDMIATIQGSEGLIHIHGRWHESDGFTLIQNKKQTLFEFDIQGKGYSYEIQACYDSIQNNMLQSELWNYTDSLALIAMCDEVRKQIGLTYPSEV